MNRPLCRRCNRPLKDPISIKRGYGPTCYAKTLQEENKTTNRIKQVEKEISLLKKQVYAIQTLPPMPQNYNPLLMPAPGNLPTIPNGHNQPTNPIPLMAGGWDIDELENNDLFLKMKALANACE